MEITTERTLTIILNDVALIEVEDVVPGVESGDWSGRTVRFTTHEGEVLEVSCEAVGQTSLQVQQVPKLTPVDWRKVRKPTWRRPKLYKPK